MKNTFWKRERIEIMIALALFNYVFLGAEYLFDNMMAFQTDSGGVVLAQSYVLGSSTVGFLLFGILDGKLRERAKKAGSAGAGVLAAVCLWGIQVHQSYGSILAAGLMLHSCLDLDPQDQLAETNIWSSPADYKLFANQFYSWTRDFSSLDNNSTKPLHSDYNSDLFTCKDDRNRFSNGTNSVQESDGNYGSAYAHIRRTNLLLQNASNYANQTDIAQYVGEAKFFRAYFYFELVQLYGDAIIVKTRN